jgi:hypothetical protein
MNSQIEDSAAELEEAPSWSELYSRAKKIGENKVSELDPRSTTMPGSEWSDWQFEDRELEETVEKALGQVDTAPNGKNLERNAHLKQKAANKYGRLSLLPGLNISSNLAGAGTYVAANELGSQSPWLGAAAAITGAAGTAVSHFATPFVIDHISPDYERKTTTGNYGDAINLEQQRFFNTQPGYGPITDEDGENVFPDPRIDIFESGDRNLAGILNGKYSEPERFDDSELHGFKSVDEERNYFGEGVQGLEDVVDQISYIRDNSENLEVWLKKEDGNPFYTVGITGA